MPRVRFSRSEQPRRNRQVVVCGLAHAGLAVTRSLGRTGVPVTGVAFDKNDLGLGSRYLRHRYVVGDRDPDRRDAALLAILADAARTGRVVLIPERDEHVSFVLRNWDEVVALADMPLPRDAGVVRRLHRKDQVLLEAQKAGIDAPATAAAQTEADVRAAGLRPPVLVKPVAGHDFARTFGTKAIAADTIDEAVAAWRLAREHGFELIVQELVPAVDSRVFSLFTYVGRSGRPLASVVARKIRQNPPRFGNGAVFQVECSPTILALGCELLKSAGFCGFAEVEFAHDGRDGGYKLIEVNPRVPAWAGLAMGAHFDAAPIAYDDLCGFEPEREIVLRERVVWLYLARDIAASLKLARRRGLRFAEFIAPYRARKKSRAVFAIDDPWPAARSLVDLASKTLARLVGGRF